MNEDKCTRHVFIIGSKGIPARYGGFETFVERLVLNSENPRIQYHVACMAKERGTYEFAGAECFRIKVPEIGPAKAVYYDVAAFCKCLSYIKKHGIERPLIYVLACRIGPFVGILKHFLKKRKGLLWVNPDGHEWLRAKWNAAIRKYWKFSEKLMVKHADCLICDSKNIEKYIHEEYEMLNPKTVFIAYGTDCTTIKEHSDETKDKLSQWYQCFGLEEMEYYLVVGRFVPENNYETILTEFIKSNTEKKLVFITNYENNKFYQELKERTQFDKDRRIIFAGTVYDSELLTAIRENAYAYFHGHEVGGTNPSLLEAMSTTELNLLLDVGFNREVGEDGALYWTKEEANLSSLIEAAEQMDVEERCHLSQRAKARMQEEYSWKHIVALYERSFEEIE